MDKKNVTMLVFVAIGIALVVAVVLYSGSGIPKETAEAPADLSQEAGNVDSFGADLAALKEGDTALSQINGFLAETADTTASPLDASAITNEAASIDFSQDLTDLKQSDSQLVEIGNGLDAAAQ